MRDNLVGYLGKNGLFLFVLIFDVFDKCFRELLYFMKVYLIWNMIYVVIFICYVINIGIGKKVINF